MKKGGNILYELCQEQKIESDCQINDIFANYNSSILIVSKTLKNQEIVILNLYQFKEGLMKQFQIQSHSQTAIYRTPNSNMFISQHIYDYEIILRNQSYVALNSSKYLNQMQFQIYQLGNGKTQVNLAKRNHIKFCYFTTYYENFQFVMNDQEDICIYSYKIKIVKELAFRNYMKNVSKSAIVFNKKQKGAWVKFQKIEDNYYVQAMLFNQSTQELICSCVDEYQSKGFINIFKLKNGSNWSVTKQLKIVHGQNSLYFLNQKTLAVFYHFDYQLNLYQLQENGWFKKFKCIEVMEIDESLQDDKQQGDHQSQKDENSVKDFCAVQLSQKQKGNIIFSECMQFHIVYNNTTLNIIDINAEEDQILQKRIEIAKTNSFGYSSITQDGKYYINFSNDQKKLQIYKIDIIKK
ncbi:unnamed protein product [Paramecium octaurelia]|uniref:Uncharacterized protein n=1 Tax=Paramecium octaurelia TaxID=43137 RepID=A0A8S1WTL5_PAROT|nr:unnamed protein product [Paramecium octaurelia]